MKITRRMLPALLLVVSLIPWGVGTAVAAPAPDPLDMAIYLRGKLIVDSGVIVGDSFAVDGDVEFGSGGNSITGTIYMSDQRSLIGSPPLGTTIETVSGATFSEEYPSLIGFPDTSGYDYIASYAPVWGDPALVIDKDTHFGSLTLSGGQGSPLVVDTSGGDVYIVVDSFSWLWGKSVKVQGNKRMFLFIDALGAVSGPLFVENGNNADSTYVFSRVSLSQSNLSLHAHVYYSGISSLSHVGMIYGSLFTDAGTLSISGGTYGVKGLVYAPDSDASVASTAKIEGRLVAKTLSVTGNGRVEYDDTYADPQWSLPDEVVQHPVHIEASDLGWGTVAIEGMGSPAQSVDHMVDYGTTVKLEAYPSPGYVFDGFEAGVPGSPMPDQYGYLAVTGPVSVIARFVAEQGPPVGYKNGLLGSYYDAKESSNPSALKMKRIDSQIAFNFGFGSPDSSIEPEYFSIIWEGFISPEVTGNYTFKTYSDDGVRLWVNGEKIIDRWGEVSLDFTVADQAVHLEAGEYYPIKLEYQQLPLYAGMFWFWESQEVPMELVPSSVLFVSEEDYDDYSSPQYFNPLLKTGTGFTNRFYVHSEWPNGTPDHIEGAMVNYVWLDGAPGSIESDKFYGKMEGWLEAPFTEGITLVFLVDDAIKVWVDGVLVVDEWDWHSDEYFEATVPMVSGEFYHVLIEYADFGLGATCRMGWKGVSLPSQIVPAKHMYTERPS